MRKSTYLLIINLTSLAIITSCGQKKDNDNIDNSKKVSVKELAFKVPTAKSRDLVKVDEVQKGEYLIAEILTSYEGKKDYKFISLFKLSMAQIGKPKSGDAVTRAMDWKKVDTNKIQITPYVEINLPLRIESDKGALEFKDNRYFYAGNETNGEGNWGMDGTSSSKGDLFYLWLQSSKEEGGIYSLGKPDGEATTTYVERNIAIQQLDANTIVITVQRAQENLEINYQLTYRK